MTIEWVWNHVMVLGCVSEICSSFGFQRTVQKFKQEKNLFIKKTNNLTPVICPMEHWLLYLWMKWTHNKFRINIKYNSKSMYATEQLVLWVWGCVTVYWGLVLLPVTMSPLEARSNEWHMALNPNCGTVQENHYRSLCVPQTHTFLAS